jgi:signal transduction histidine kinase
MRIASRRKTIATFVTLGTLLVAVTAALNVGWIILNWREGLMLFLGVIFFAVVIAGLVLNTIFLVREVRRNEQQDSFLNAVTHELKTPIASIRLYLETLQRRAVDEAKAREFYAVMLADTDRLMGTIEQVLRAGEQGHKRPLQSEVDVDLTPLVEQCVELARTRHHLPAEAMSLNNDGNGLIVIGEPEDLRTAIMNVLDNAVKYSHGGEVKIEVALRADGADAELAVRDHGRGIPPADLKRVFKRFYRVAESGSKVKGTGLGLFIVHSIVERHGGSVRAESAGAGKGTTIRIRLPRYHT